MWDEAIGRLKPRKSDASGISTELLKYGTPVVSEIIADLFTNIKAWVQLSANFPCFYYSLSKILEHIILDKYSHYLFSSYNQLQFGFKSCASTSLCTGLVNNIASRYIFNGSTVLGCLLDASKAILSG